MTSGFLKLNLADVSKGLVVAVIVAVLKFLEGLLADKGLNLSLSDVSPILDLSVTTAVAYLVKNVFSDESGKFLGRVG